MQQNLSKQFNLHSAEAYSEPSQIFLNILNQATKFCCIGITGFRYSYFTVRVTTNDSSVPSFH